MYLAKSFKEVIEKGNWTKEIESVMEDNSESENSNSDFKKKYSKLKGIHLLQKSIVRQNMHNAMSPISAISGYLELINMSLSENPDLDQIEYYRKKIESGIQEVNNIIEQLQVIYNDDADTIAEEELRSALIEVDLNWIVREVMGQLHFQNEDLAFEDPDSPLHIKTDLYIIKLIIFNLISYASKNSVKNSLIELQTGNEDNHACFGIMFAIADLRMKELNELMNVSKVMVGTNDSFTEGLVTSIELAEQVSGTISVKTEDNNKVRLELKVPLSAPVN